ncbi:TolC family protein [Wenzhouxiangellaceae bacterium CH-27]|uniref:TolC family protein n=2 Tax=Elongatibacter sediminis TaxID=3119006 RepID=A0AAW9RL54_9GAMM
MRLPIQGMALILSFLPIIAWPNNEIRPTENLLFERHPDPALSEFVRTVVETNPRVQAAMAALEASRAYESAAGKPLYNPELEAGYESAVDDTWEVGIGQTFDWSGKRKARERVAASDRYTSEAAYEAVRREVSVNLLSGLAAFQTGKQRESLAAERVEIMEDFSELAQRRFAAGDLTQVEADLATLASVDAQIQRATAAADLAEATQVVRSLTLASASDQWPMIDTDLPRAATIDDPQRFVLSLPEIQVAQRRLDAANAAIELRESERKPDPRLSLRGGREDDSTLVGINLSIPLYIRNNYKFEVSAAVAERDQVQQIFDDKLRHAYARLLSASERYQLSRDAWEGWQRIGQASLQRQVELLRRLWEAGELSTTDYLVQLQQTLDTRWNALNLELTMWNAWFEWLAATGSADNWLGLENTP